MCLLWLRPKSLSCHACSNNNTNNAGILCVHMYIMYTVMCSIICNLNYKWPFKINLLCWSDMSKIIGFVKITTKHGVTLEVNTKGEELCFRSSQLEVISVKPKEGHKQVISLPFSRTRTQLWSAITIWFPTRALFVHNCLIDHLLSHSLLSSWQFGFRSNSSTKKAFLFAA